METLLQDIRYAVRTLARARGFAFVALACLALGIGVNTAMFSIVYAIMFRQLPFEEPERIVALSSANPTVGEDDGGLTFADLRDLAERTGAFDQLGGAVARNFTLMGTEITERVPGASVTPGLFGMLGLPPALGREFRAEDAAPMGFEQTVILSDVVWRTRFAADPGILGRAIRLNGRELVVVGVMPPNFGFPETARIWLPLGAQSAEERQGRFIWGVGRLAPGVSVADAHERVELASAQLAAEFPASHENWAVRVESYRDALIDPDTRRLLLLTLGAVMSVLLIACANVANLLLARATDRTREISVRAAIGATRSRIARQLLTESVLLSFLGAVGGVLIAVWWVDGLVRAIPEDLAYWIDIKVDGSVLLYTFAIAAATGLLFGMVPALQAARGNLYAGVREGARGGEARGRGHLRSALVVGEIALSLVLLISASLFVRSFLRVQAAQVGFDHEAVTSLRLGLAGDQYDTFDARIAFATRAATMFAQLPGVTGAAATTAVPTDDGGAETPLYLATSAADDEALLVSAVGWTENGLAAIGAPLVEGREFTASEVSDTLGAVAILGASLARRLFPDGALGRSIRLGGGLPGTYAVIGVAPDLVYEELTEETEISRLQVHLPFGRMHYRNFAFLVRASGDPAALAQPIREELKKLDPTLAPFEQMTMAERRYLTNWSSSMFGRLFSTFGVLALVLALAGVYGVMAYAVARRQRELGVRLALGATPIDVQRLVLGRAGVLALAGIAAGTVIAYGVTRLLGGLLYDVRANDPATFIVFPVALAAAALLASWVPAHRASRVDPAVVLRAD